MNKRLIYWGIIILLSIPFFSFMIQVVGWGVVSEYANQVFELTFMMPASMLMGKPPEGLDIGWYLVASVVIYPVYSLILLLLAIYFSSQIGDRRLTLFTLFVILSPAIIIVLVMLLGWL